ncbi:MAG: GxxExxY protein, partial [Anaerolineae bacterium]
AIELAHREIPFQREVALPIHYRGQRLRTSYRVDFLCYGNVIVELKALAKLSSVEEAQLLNYLKASNIGTGLLLNFGTASLQYKRFILDPQKALRQSVQST